VAAEQGIPPRTSALEAADHCSILSDSERKIAQAVAGIVLNEIREQLRPREWISAQELSRRIGFERPWIYRHRHELGVEYFAGRPRFDPEVAIERARALGSSARRTRPPRPKGRGNKRRSGRRAKPRSGASGRRVPRSGAVDG
jgi:hypothetical protein